MRLFVSLLILLRRGVLATAQQEPTTSELITREYFSSPQSHQETCTDACARILGHCNSQRITQLALDTEQCHDAVIAHAEWVNSGDRQRLYALFPSGSGINLNASGECLSEQLSLVTATSGYKFNQCTVTHHSNPIEIDQVSTTRLANISHRRTANTMCALTSQHIQVVAWHVFRIVIKLPQTL